MISYFGLFVLDFIVYFVIFKLKKNIHSEAVGVQTCGG